MHVRKSWYNLKTKNTIMSSWAISQNTVISLYEPIVSDNQFIRVSSIHTPFRWDNVTDIVVGLHLLRILLDSVEGKCLVVAIGMLLVCHHIAMTKTRNLDHIFYVALNALPKIIVEVLFCIFFFQCKTPESLLQHAPHNSISPPPATSQWYLGEVSIESVGSTFWKRKRRS